MSENKKHDAGLWSEAEWNTYESRPKGVGQLIQRCKDDPLIPVFCGATVIALLGGMKSSFFSGNPKMAQKFMIARVTCQALSVCAIGWSIFKFADRYGGKK